MTAGELEGLTRSCPNLTGLRTLKISDTSDADVRFVLQLSELQDLELSDSCLSDAAIHQLTQMAQLVQLRMEVKREEEEQEGLLRGAGGCQTSGTSQTR